MDVFISYSQIDKPWVSKLANTLEAQGYTVWWDHKILAGDDFDEVIQEKLKQVKCVVTVWSENSIKSNWVRGESNIALDSDKLIPISIQAVNPPVVFRTIHTLNLKAWKGDALDPQFIKLLDSIRQFCPSSPDNLETQVTNNIQTEITKKSKILPTFLLSTLVGTTIGSLIYYAKSPIAEELNKYISSDKPVTPLKEEITKNITPEEKIDKKSNTASLVNNLHNKPKPHLDKSIKPSKEELVKVNEEVNKGIEAYRNDSFQLAEKIFTPLAKKYNGIAQSYLGTMYYTGKKGVKQNKDKAERLNMKAFLWADNNQTDPKAMFVLARLYDKGYAVGKSFEKAAKWYQKSSDNGYSQASAYLGDQYQKGEGVDTSDPVVNNKKAVEYFQKALDQDPNNKYAQFQLGYMYEFGLGVKQSDKEAFKWYQKAADNGFAQALANLGNFYQNGRGIDTCDTKANNKKAVEYYRQAIDHEPDNRHALYNLAVMYDKGLGVKQSDKEALKLYQKAAKLYQKALDKPPKNKGDQFRLAYMYELGLGVEQSDKKAFELYKEAAEKRSSSALANLGNFYHKGRGVGTSDPKANNKKAVEYYQKSLKQDPDYAYAQFKLGYMYNKGLGVKKSYKKAVEWYQKAAKNKGCKQGNPWASANLGSLYQKGRVDISNTKANNKKAVELYRQALKQDPDNRFAQFKLAYMYDLGFGVKQSDKEASKWYKKAAANDGSSQGQADASANLGNFYLYGRGVDTSNQEANYKEAKRLFKQAIVQDPKNGYAQYKLGYMYENGLGVKQSDDKAFEWYQKASDNGYAKASFALERYNHSVNTSNPEPNYREAKKEKNIPHGKHPHLNPCTNKLQIHDNHDDRNRPHEHNYGCKK